ncbi:MAG: IgGFc-binding protein, partial [Deltaproteobacteria bacterium]|nr:IgGFc-binding protein [Deltaproteobacteria bacterium]
MARRLGFVSLVLVLFAAAACSAENNDRFRFSDGAMPRPDGGGGPSCSAATGVVCLGLLETQCNADGTFGAQRDCGAMGLTCASGLGCRVCEPNRGSCSGNTTQVCRADGSGFDPGPECDASAGESCNASTGQCTNLCRSAAESQSYIGCEYWPATVLNPSLPPEFEFAVAVANPQAVDARVTVDRGGTMVADVVVPPGGLETIPLASVAELKGNELGSSSALVRGGAYHLVSTVPVTVYQFNALEYRLARDCAGETAAGLDGFDGQCFSYTNDASLLLPTHVLTGNYIVASYGSQMIEVEDPLFGDTQLSPQSPGFFSVIAVEDSTVTIRFRAHVLASGDGQVTAFRPGDTGTFTMARGDVLQILTGAAPSCNRRGTDMLDPLTVAHYCDTGRDYDLTGTEIQATGRVSVISGHGCAFVPFNRWACDHLEEAIFPLEAWGKDVLLSTTQPIRGEPNLVRVISGHDGNNVTFDPPVMAPRTMNRGDIVELETRDPIRIQGSEALLVVQFLVGQDYAGIGSSGMMGVGDPSISLGIPTEQFRTEYTFLAPLTYEMSFANITAPDGQSVLLDGTPVSGFAPIGGTGMSAARVAISGGVHTVTSSMPFGLTVYGFGS